MKTISTLPLPTPKPGTLLRLPYATIVSMGKSPSGPKNMPLRSSSLSHSCHHPPATTSSKNQTTTPTSMGRSRQSKISLNCSTTPPSHTPRPTPARIRKTSKSPKLPPQDHNQSSPKEWNHWSVSKMKASKSTTRVIEGNTQSPSTISRRKN